MIKDNDLIADTQTDDKTNTTTYIINNHNEKNNNNKTKLGEVFNYLPHGIIDKTETGIGGTSLELDSNRNSIIVQPYNNVAESKSKVKSLVNKYDVLFFSSNSYYKSTNKKPTSKISKTLSTKSSDPISRLNEYIIDCDKNKKPIKIICIINQIQELYEYLKTLKNHPANKFHLVLDEIDTLQEHSSFRNEASTCFKIYKSHDPKNRTMISATLMKFHDKDLENEPVTILKYQITNKPLIDIKYSTNIKEEAIRNILSLSLNSKDKIVIACNNFNYCNEIIKALENDSNLKKRSIKILCSINQKSKVKAGKYYGEMLPKGILPADITFFTAAYFSGHDINERYHNIILAEKLSSTLRLSPRLIYQITGRCRDEKGPYSNHLILALNSNIKINYTMYTAKTLIDNVANKEALFEFTSALKKTSNKYMKAVIESMENVFYEGSSKVPSVFDENKKGKPEISYFKVDSIIEEQKTYKLYLNWRNFNKELGKRFKLSFTNKLYKTGDIKLIVKKDTKQSASSLLIKLNKLDRELDYITMLRKIELDISIPVSSVEKVLLSLYKSALNNENINLVKLSKVTEKIISGKQIKARLEELDFYIKFNKNVMPDKLFQLNIVEHLPIGDVITTEILNKKITLIVATFKRMSKTQSPIIKSLINELGKNSSLFKNSLLQAREKNTNKAKGVIILGHDKYQILSD